MLSFASFTALVALLPFIAASPIEKRLTGQVIRSGRTNTCLTVQPGVQIIPGTQLTVGDCSTATLWDISPGSGSVLVSGTNFALDAGSNPANFVQAKVWTSYPGLAQQTWYLTPDNRIAITGGTQCLDLSAANIPQTYQCTPNNGNQVWLVQNPPSGPTSSVSATTTSGTSSPSSTPTGPPNRFAAQIQWTGGCLAINGPVANETPVVVSQCLNPTDPNAASQLWVYMNNAIQLANTPFCMDAGVNPASGVGMKIYQCYFGLAQQTFTYSANGLFQTVNNQCLDVDNNGNTRVQTWACSATDPQQVFGLGGPPPPISSSSPSPSATTTSVSMTSSSTTSPSTTPTGPPNRFANPITWTKDGSQCLTVQGPLANNTPVNLATCNGSDSQRFVAISGGIIQVINSNFCLDAGSTPANGTPLKIYTCYSGLPQQTWNFPGGGLIQTANNQCIDVNNQGNTMVQTWACSASDPQQIFNI